MKKVIIDIGTHKTGTTSRQEVFGVKRDWLRSLGVDYYEGIMLNNNHVDLHMSCMDIDRLSPARIMYNNGYDADSLRSMVANKIFSFISSSPCHVLLFSAEGLSYLRYKHEVDCLFDFFQNCSIHVVVYLRDRVSFLDSYTKTLEKCQIPRSEDIDSFAYVGEDTWLVDYDRFSKLYIPKSNCDAFTVFDYNNITKTFGSVVPHFFEEVLGIKTIAKDMHSFWLNRS
jgi:hypothetical protein